MSELPRILLVAYKIKPGTGSEDGSGYHIAAELARRRCHLTIVTRTNNLDALRPDPAFAEVELVGVDVPRALGFFKRGGRGIVLYYYLWQLAVGLTVRRLTRSRRFDVLHQLNFHTDWAPHFLGGDGTPVVWGPIAHHRRTPSAFFAADDRWGRASDTLRFAVKRAFWTFDPFLRAAAQRTAVVLYANEDVAPPFVPLASKRRLRPYAGSFADPPTDVVGAIESGRFRVLWVGRFVPLKGLLPTVRAFARFVERHGAATPAELVIVGHGPQAAAARQLVTELGIAERVHFLPWLRQDELSPHYDDASVLLYPSVEAQGLVVAEALAHGVPPVTISGTGPSVLAGNVGWKVTGSDLVEELADALSDAHSEWLEGVLIHRRVEARRQYDRALDWTRIVDDLELVYAGVRREVARAA